jgi:uncharacterized protein YhdP
MKSVPKRWRTTTTTSIVVVVVVVVVVSLGNITLCRMYTSTLSDQTQVTLQMTVNLADLMSRFLTSLPLLEGSKVFFPWPRTRFRWPCMTA